MSDPLEAARAALRDRQGSGARYDAVTAPAVELAWARRGTAYFARLLNALSDDELAAPSCIPGWSRRHLVAHVGYHARALCRLIEGQRMYASNAARDAEVAFGATLPARALRHLFSHTQVHLNVNWRDLTDDQWTSSVPVSDFAEIALRDTAWMRAQEVWLAAFDLGNGGSFQDFPAGLLDRLITLNAMKSQVRLALNLTDRNTMCATGPDTQGAVTGKAADIARWLSGRGASNLHSSTGSLPDITQRF